MMAKGPLGVDATPEQMRPGPWRDPNNPSELLLFHVYARTTAEGLIIDPTRWCYEDTEPYIYYGAGDGLIYDGTPMPTDSRL